MSVHEAGGFLGDAPGQITAVLEYLIAVAPQVVEVDGFGLSPIVAMRKIVHTTIVKTVEIIEAVRVGRCIGRGSEMPFPDESRGVAGGLEERSDRFLTRRKLPAVDRHTGANGVAASHQRGAGRGTDRRVRIPIDRKSTRL